MKNSIVKNALNWFDERTGLVKFFTEFMHEEIPGGTRFSYTLGSACMFLLSIQFISGIWHLFYYVPTVDYAYSSLTYLRLHVPFGWLIHGFHFWGGTLFTFVVGLHVIRVFIWGAYKKPRELVWLIGIFLIILTALFMFTGPVLPWDKKGYWAGQVGLGIAGSVPVVGEFTQQLLQGGSSMGQSALMRMYVLHVAVLPGLIVVFVLLHLIAFRQYGESGPWVEEKRKKVGYFWPEQIFKDVVVALLLFLLLVYLSAFHPPHFTGLADPSDTLYTPKPEWPFLFLYEALKYLPGHLEFVATAGVPLAIVLLFGSLPFLDKSPVRDPFKRGFVMLGGFAFICVIFFLTWKGYIYKSPAELSAIEKVEPHAGIGLHNTKNVAPHQPVHEPMSLVDAANKREDITGEELFKTLGCTECHGITGGPTTKQGPDLVLSRANNRSREWLYLKITNPEKDNVATIMPPYSHLSAKNINKLIDYLNQLTPSKEVLEAQEALKVAAAQAPVAGEGDKNVAIGEQLFTAQGCTQCHDVRGRASRKQGPDLMMSMQKYKRDSEWLYTQLVAPQQHNPISIMPSYANRMKEEELRAVVSFMESLTHRTPVPVSATEPADEGSQGPTKSGYGHAVNIVGDYRHGALLYYQNCRMCHGPNGNVDTPGFKKEKGVPSIAPISRARFSNDSQSFVEKIDLLIQHGIPNTQGGPDMPAFGSTNSLTQAQIADIEAYVLAINGVDRVRIVNPGVDPKEFFYILLGIFMIITMIAGFYWWVLKILK